MRTVDKTTFFEAVGRLDLMPSIAHSKWDDTRGYESLWKTRDGAVKGRSYGGTHLMETVYELEEPSA